MRKVTREKVMELLYMLDIYRQVLGQENLLAVLHNMTNEADITTFIADEKAFLLNNKDDIPYFEATFHGVLNQLEMIDTTIQKYMKSTWSVDQIGFVERAILRLAVYELNWSEQDGLVTEVIIATALELAEKYTDEQSVKFIHGILGAMTHQVMPKQASRKKPKTYQKVESKTAKANLAKYKKLKENTRNKK